MPQKRGEVVEEVEAGKTPPDTYENWLKKQVKARSGSLGNQEEDDIDNTEDVHKKAHRRKRGRGAGASNP